MIAVVYSKAQKVRRRLIKLDHEGAKYEDFGPHKDVLHEGEGWLEIPTQVYDTFNDANELDAYLAGEIGSPESDRCVVVCPEGNVKCIVKADPAIDYHPEGEIIAHAEADKEWKLNNQEWIAPEKIETVEEPSLRATQDTFDLDTLTSSAKFSSFGTDWNIQCIGDDLIIGCQTLPISTWEKLTDAEVGIMAEPILQTAKWWRDNRDDILTFAHEHQKRLQK